MLSRVMEKIVKHGFWLSLLLHLLILLALLFFMTKPKNEEKKPERLPHYFVPAYTYSGSIKPSVSKQQAHQAEENVNQPSEEKVAEKVNENSEDIESVEQTLSEVNVPKNVKKMPVKKFEHLPRQQKSMLASSFNMLKDEQMQEVAQKDESEPIYMIGDDSMPADPLIKLLGRSLSAHFRYPHIPGQLGIHGRVLISLVLHPEGYYSNVKIMQSSSNQDLDQAALYAVNSAPRIYGADRFIQKPKHFVVGFVFN